MKQNNTSLVEIYLIVVWLLSFAGFIVRDILMLNGIVLMNFKLFNSMKPFNEEILIFSGIISIIIYGFKEPHD